MLLVLAWVGTARYLVVGVSERQRQNPTSSGERPVSRTVAVPALLNNCRRSRAALGPGRRADARNSQRWSTMREDFDMSSVSQAS